MRKVKKNLIKVDKLAFLILLEMSIIINLGMIVIQEQWKKEYHSFFF